MDDLRPLLTVYAYNILGSYEDAKDVVQDTFLKFSQIGHEQINNSRAYLIRMVVNLAIDQKRKQKKRRAAYPGEWLPEPVATEDSESPVHRREILSYSLMVLLEKLNARQRAVFILKEAFDYEHEEIAAILGITVENSRKTLSRARTQLQSESPLDSTPAQREHLDRYLEIIQQGDIKQLEQLLSEEVDFTSDGGGKSKTALHPVYGRQSVLALLNGFHKKFHSHMRVERKWVNHQPALLYYEDDKLITCEILVVNEGRIDHVYVVRNPDKLASL